MDKEQIRKALDHFENDKFMDAKTIIAKEIETKRNDYLKDKLGLKDNLSEASLTRKHFVALANMMKNAKTIDQLKEDILSWLQDSNPRFDVQRFRDAAGM